MAHYDLPHNHEENIDKVLDTMPCPEDFQDVALLFQQLGDPTRLKLIWLICHTEECVCNLAAALGVSAPAVSHHLKSLRQNELIVSRRAGKEVFYTLADTVQARMLHQTIDALFRITCPTSGKKSQ